MAVIENHNGDSLANVYSNARNNYYGISGYPTYYFDGILSVVGGSGSSSLYSTFVPKVNQRNAVLSDFTIHLTFTNTGNNYQATATINNVGGNTASNLVVQAIITESNLPIPWGLTSVQDFTNRLMVPNQNGTSLSLSGGGTQIVPLNFTMADYWDSDHCELVVFVQNNSGKEILQGAKLSLSGPPQVEADFEADNTIPALGETVSFTDLSSENPTSWAWSFTPSTITYVGGTNSSSQNPQVQFNTEAAYTVSLTATNVNGNDTETKLNYIHATYYCGATGGGSFLHISNVQIGTINNTTGQDNYSDFTYLSTDLFQNQSGVSISVTNGAIFGGEDLGIWIDWDQDGDFYDADENIVCEIDDDGQGTFTFDVPGTALLGTTKMRVRNKYNGSDCGDPCGPTTYGEVEDYSVNIIVGTTPPVANFEANNITPGIGETVNFTDLSTNSPTSWAWTFTPSTIAYVGLSNSTSQNPQVQFDAAGNYTVSLIATNSGGSDTETKLNYINVTIPYIDLEITVFLEGPFDNGSMNTDQISMLPLSQPFNMDPWYYTGTESVAAIPGTDIVDWVLIELRDASTASLADANSAFDWQAAFIRNDGKIVDMNGNPVLHFESTASQSLFVVVHHKNHLSIMSANGIVETDGDYSYDFSDANEKAHGTVAQKMLGAGIYGMYGGDGNRDGTIDVLDRSPLWENEAGTGGYHESDFNLDGESNNQDKNDCWLPNEGQSEQVPD